MALPYVTARVLEQAVEELKKKIGEGGTTVVANPEGEATNALEKLQVGENIYSIEGGGTSSSKWLKITATPAPGDVWGKNYPATDSTIYFFIGPTQQKVLNSIKFPVLDVNNLASTFSDITPINFFETYFNSIRTSSEMIDSDSNDIRDYYQILADSGLLNSDNYACVRVAQETEGLGEPTESYRKLSLFGADNIFDYIPADKMNISYVTLQTEWVDEANLFNGINFESIEMESGQDIFNYQPE